MRAYLVDLIDRKTQVRQRIWVKSEDKVTPQKMKDYVQKIEGLRLQEPQLLSYQERRMPSYIRQELIEKNFPVHQMT